MLRHAYLDQQIDVRLPEPDRLQEARQVAAAGEEKTVRWQYVLSVSGVLRLWEQFKDNPRDTLPVHAIRVGDLGIAPPTPVRDVLPVRAGRQATQPGRGDDGLPVDRRPSPATAPTVYGCLGGGYSGDPIYWTRLEPFAGYRLVDTAAGLLGGLWRG